MGERYIEFSKYLNLEDVYVNQSLKIDMDITYEGIISYIHSISEFHKRAMGYDDYIDGKLPDNIGCYIENCRTELKRLERYLNTLMDKKEKNMVDRFLLTDGIEVIETSKATLRNCYKNNMMQLIQRSMDNHEVSLGSFYPYNIVMSGDNVYVKTLNKCCYDTIETDYIRMFAKVKKYNRKILNKELIYECLQAEGLGKDSYEFIKSLVMFPYDFLRQANRYKDMRKSWTLEYYLKKMKESIDKYRDINI